MDGATAVPPRRIPAKAFMTEAQLADVRTIPCLLGVLPKQLLAPGEGAE